MVRTRSIQETEFDPGTARQMLARDKSYFTVQEMTELLSTLADERIPEGITQQICNDIMTYPYYDSLAMWLESDEWKPDNRLYSVFTWLIKRERYSDLPALLRTRGYGKRFRAFLKLKGISKPLEKMILARLSLDEALWRIRNPNSDIKALRGFLLEQITKLESA